MIQVMKMVLFLNLTNRKPCNQQFMEKPGSRSSHRLGSAMIPYTNGREKWATLKITERRLEHCGHIEKNRQRGPVTPLHLPDMSPRF